ncbi:MAG: hypothetical protein ACKV2O_02300, partial [Acidimicrobiales bacterium]
MSRFRSVKDPLQPKAKRAVPRRWRRRALASLLSPAIFAGLLVGNASVSPAAAPTGAGFTITKGDISYIIEQIRIAEAHDARTNSTTGPCGAMIKPVGTATALPYQLDHAGLPFGLRTVDGSCNNLVQDQEYFATAAGFETNPATGANPLAYDYIPALFPRYADPVFRDAQVNTFSTRIGV